MGSIEFQNNQFIIFANIITYGNAATADLSDRIREEIETMWNEPKFQLSIHGFTGPLGFRITAELNPSIQPVDIYQNLDPRNNYFRIEEFALNNISFVDGLRSNSGYFKVENLYKGSTTAAHEFGHTLGLDHPKHLDLRGKGTPGIMYPRGTLVDPQFQYDPSKPAGVTGGTMHPMYRRVTLEDIEDLKLDHLEFENNRSIVGDFTNIYHWNHAEMPPEEFLQTASPA